MGIKIRCVLILTSLNWNRFNFSFMLTSSVESWVISVLALTRISLCFSRFWLTSANVSTASDFFIIFAIDSSFTRNSSFERKPSSFKHSLYSSDSLIAELTAFEYTSRSYSSKPIHEFPFTDHLFQSAGNRKKINSKTFSVIIVINKRDLILFHRYPHYFLSRIYLFSQRRVGKICCQEMQAS